MTSSELKAKIKGSISASFWLRHAINDLECRDALDALRDAEALLEFCRVRAREAGLNV